MAWRVEHGARDQVVCSVEVVIDPEGEARRTSLAGSCPEPFDAGLAHTFSGWRFRPVKVDKERRWVRVVIPIAYVRQGSQAGVILPEGLLLPNAEMALAP